MFTKLTTFASLYCLCIVTVEVVSLNTLKNNARLTPRLNTHSLLFQTLDLVKVFGRLSDPSLIGSVIPSSKDRLGTKTSVNNLKWRSLFEDESEELDIDKFTKRLVRSSFSWPLDYTSNRTAPFLIPLKFRSKFKIKCRCIPVDVEMYNSIKAKIANLNNLENINEVTIAQLNEYLKDQPINANSIESTFKALSGEEDRLTVEHMMAYINYRSPLVEMINWNCFISSLPVGPEDAWHD